MESESNISTGSLLIRAPVTIDDDDDDDNSSYISESNGARVVVTDSGNGSSSSISSNDSEGFVSGGEEFETASERPDPDEEMVEESGFVDKYRVSRPFVVDPDEEFSQKSIGSDVSDGPVVDLALNVKPIAQLSMDDDDGFGFDELSGGDIGFVSEWENGGGGVSPIVKVPIIGRVDSAPRIKVMESDDEEDEPFSEPLSPRKFVDSSDLSKFVGVGIVGSSASAEATVVKGSADDLVSVELVGDKRNGVTPGAHNVDGKGDVSGFVDNYVEQGPTLQNSVQEKTESKDQDGHEIQECGAGLNHIEELKVEVEGMNAEEEPSDSQNNLCSSFDDSVGVSLDRDTDDSNLESKTEPEIDSGVYLYDPLAVISAEPADGAVNVKKIQAVDSKSSESLQNGDLCGTVEGDRLEDAESSASRSCESEAEADGGMEKIGGRQEGLLSDEFLEEIIFGSTETTKLGMHGLEERLACSSAAESGDSQDHSQRIEGQMIIMESDDELEIEKGGEGNELFDSATLVALLKSATDAALGGGGLTSNPTDGSNAFTHERPTGSGSLFPSLIPGPPPNTDGNVPRDNLSEEEKRRIEKIELLRVKFLRLVLRLGHSFDDSIVAQVLYRLALAFGRHSCQAFSIEPAKRVAALHEAEDKDDLNFSVNILVLGKTGVGKSATINSIFCEEKATINAFEPATASVKVIAGTVHGVKIRILDTPGLRTPATERTVNQKTLASVKKSIKKFPPDVVLYVDRLDTHTRDHNDLPLIRSITNSLGSSIWQNAILCLTHAASDPPNGPSGLALSYEMFVAQQSRVIQQSISQAVGDLRVMNPSMMHPVSLVENHQSFQRNRTGESVLPNGQSWRPQLLLLCFSLKILSEANSMLKPQGPSAPKKIFGFSRSAPLSYFLSSLLRSRTHPKLSADQGGNDVDLDLELGDLSDSNREDEDEYDQLPPFKPLGKSQVAKLSKEQRKAYFEEYDYRVKLITKKQLKDEVKRLREMKKKGNRNNYDDEREDDYLEDEDQATVPVMLPDFDLPLSFDGDNPVYRYRLLVPSSQLLVRPILDSHGWDHDCGYDGVSLERNFAIASQFPGAFAIQITKDKREFNIHLDSLISAKIGESGSTMAGLDIQTVERQLAYIFSGEAKFRNFKINKTSGGISITLLGENLATGLKIEDEIAIGKRLVLSGNAGVLQSRGDTAYGANLELRLNDKDFPIGNSNSILGLSIMNWRGDLNLTASLQSQFSVGRSSKMEVRAGLNNKRSGQITVKLSRSEQLQMALIGIVPIAVSIFRSLRQYACGQNTTY